MPVSNRDRQAARLARYRAMKFALETIRRESAEAGIRRLADEALMGTAFPTPREPSKADTADHPPK